MTSHQHSPHLLILMLLSKDSIKDEIQMLLYIEV